MRTPLLAPNFDQIPGSLRAIPRWVTWRIEDTKKVPYQTRSPFRKASATDSRTWADFESATEAYSAGDFTGVGIVLNGDGLVGIDLDDCVVDRNPSLEAQVVLDQLGCDYVELSPSGAGLRGFGYVEGASAAVGKVGTLRVELYATQRYLTVTGHPIHRGQIRKLTGWESVWRSVKFPSNTEEREALESRSSVSSGSSVFAAAFPFDSIPKAAGQRNRCLFHLARHLKAEHPGAEVDDMLPLVTQWHETFLNVIDTKIFSVTWADFKHAWVSIRFELGDKILQTILEDMPPPPQNFVKPGYDDVMLKLMSICLRLQKHQGDAPFFLGCRKAAELLCVHFTHAGALLRLLVADGFLQVVEKGRNGRATRYRANSVSEAFDGSITTLPSVDLSVCTLESKLSREA